MHVHSTRAVEHEVETLGDAPLSPPSLDRVPTPILEFHAHAVHPPVKGARVVRLEQQGELRLGPDKAWQPFLAEEYLSARDVGFVWQARVRVAPLFSAIVIDRYTHGHGELDALLFGALRVAHLDGPDADRGELMRYLAEIPWVPQAITANGALEWKRVGDREVQVTAGCNGGRCTATLELDGHGDIIRASAVRPRAVGANAVPTPWAGEFSAYAELGEMRIPTHGEVWWELPRERFVYWRGDITAAEAIC